MIMTIITLMCQGQVGSKYMKTAIAAFLKQYTQLDNVLFSRVSEMEESFTLFFYVDYI